VVPIVLDHIRSLLFVPGSDERKLRRAFQTDADLVVVDLEDAVAPAEKEAARDFVAGILPTIESACLRAIRMNGGDTPQFAADLEMVAGLALDAIVLPKATPESARAMGPEGPPVLAIVETATGLRLAYETACEARVAALVFGAADLGAELRLVPREDGQEILFARSKIVVDSAAAGIRAPIDVVYFKTRDEEGLERQALLARSLGFGAKACIHPAQLAIVNRVFAPSEPEIEWARSVLAAYDEGIRDGRGAVALNGELIDVPIVERARKILAAVRDAT
jgi:citrate lyase beta subunit